MRRADRRTVCVDFDGVLHQWGGEWKGHHVIEGAPFPGALDWLHETIQTYDVVILTTRGATWRGRRAVRAWLREHCSIDAWHEWGFGPGLEDVRVTDRKPPALVYIDDRALRFEGDKLPSAGQIRAAQPWWKRASQ